MAKANIKNEDANTDASEREAPVIKTDGFKWQAEGFAWREALVRLPAGMTAQDLQDSPQVWRLVQDSTVALKRFDRVVCVAHDESWLISAIVIDADRQKVVLDFGERVVKLPAKEAQWEDGDVVVKWGGPGYAVYRKRDDVKLLPQVFADIEQAKAEYHRTKQPQRIA